MSFIFKHVKKTKSNVLYITILILLFLLFGVQAFKVAFVRHWPDLGIYLAATKQFLHGNNPYVIIVHGGFIYPLTLTYLLIPLALIHSYISQFIWYILSVGAYIYSVASFQKIFKIPKENQLIITFIITLLFVSIIQDDLIHSNINLIILALTIASFSKLLDNNIFLGLILLSLAISIKLSPIVLFLWVILFSFKKKYNIKSAFINVSILITLISVFIVLIPFLVHGTKVLEWYNYYYDNFLLQQMKFSGVSKYNFTLAGGINTLLGQGEYPSFTLKLMSGLLLCILPTWIALFRNMIIPSFLLCLQIIPLTGTNGEQHHLVFLIPSFVYILNIAYKNTLILNRSILKFNPKYFTLLCLVLATFLLMILWGNNVPYIPIEMFGLLSVFALTVLFALNETKFERTNIYC